MNEDTPTAAKLTYDVNLATNAVTWSDALYSVYGYDQAETASASEWWSDRVHPDDAMPLNQVLDKLLDPSISEWTVAYRFRRGDNTYASVQDHAQVIRNEQGEAIRLIGTITPVAQPKI